MKVAVITPYYRESLAWLRQCHESVLAQTHPCRHFMVADGFANEAVAGWDLSHTVLPRAHADYGNTPRAVGALQAHTEGYDAVAFLDADNWFYPEHIAAMVRLHQETGAVVCTATRTLHRLDGSLMFVDRESDGDKHADTNCMFFTRALFKLLPLWVMMPIQMSTTGTNTSAGSSRLPSSARLTSGGAISRLTSKTLPGTRRNTAITNARPSRAPTGAGDRDLAAKRRTTKRRTTSVGVFNSPQRHRDTERGEAKSSCPPFVTNANRNLDPHSSATRNLDQLASHDGGEAWQRSKEEISVPLCLCGEKNAAQAAH